MWFKRRKKSEQNHALSESLRSLQNLLNDTGRQEPQLDNLDDGEPGLADSKGAESPGGLKADGPAPPEPGNRWQELSLSFDAEPLIPRPVHPASSDDGAPSEDLPETAQVDARSEPGEGDLGPAGGTAPAAPSDDNIGPPEASPRSQQADGARDEAGVEPVIGTTSSLWSDDDAGTPVNSLEVLEAGGDYDDGEADPTGLVHPGEPAEPFQQAPEPPALDAPDAELELYGLDPDTDDCEPVLPDSERIEQADPLEGNTMDDAVEETEATPESDPRSATAASTPSSHQQPSENQLHLQLEPTDEPADADIPTLTQAVYVPDAPSDAPAPASFKPAQDTTLVDDIELLRSRLWNMDLNALSPEQQVQLHKGLNELLDKLE